LSVRDYQLTNFAVDTAAQQRMRLENIDCRLDRRDWIQCGSRILVAQELERALDVSAPNRLPAPWLWTLCRLADCKPFHPCVHIVCTIDLAGFFDVGIGGEGLFDKAAHLLFVVGMPFDSINNQAMRRASRLLGQGTYSGAQFWG
jgi:hypothetical protein